MATEKVKQEIERNGLRNLQAEMLYRPYLHTRRHPSEEECVEDLKFKYRNSEFWCKGYYVDTAGKNALKIQEYIKHHISGESIHGP